MRILYLDVDTLRPDHLGCYGYQRNTSPNIDSVAREAVRFTNYHCSDAPCLPSRTSLMTGRFGIHTGVVGHGGTAADMRLEGANRGFSDRLRHESVPGFLRSVGLKTVTISPFAERHSAWHFYAGFSEMYNSGQSGRESAEEVTPLALKWIQANASDDHWFLHLNYWDPHTPYRAPLELGNPFEQDPLPEWLTEEILAEHRARPGPHRPREVNMYDDYVAPQYPRQLGEIKDMADWRRMIDGYDCGIRYMDGHVGQLFDALKEQGVWDDVMIIISSDHGENLGELGIYGEHATADKCTGNIPLIVRWPGGRAGHVDSGLHYNLDLAPTLAELFEKEPIPSWDGQSFAPSLLQGEDCGRESLVIGQCAHTCQRSVRMGPWLCMRTYHDGFHLFPDEMLFNLEQDPHEQYNLAESHSDVCREAVGRLHQWHDEMMRTMPEGYDVDPLWTVLKEGGPFHARGHLKAYCERLEQTGRGQFIPELKRRHPQEFT